MSYTDLRLLIRRFFRKNAKVILILFLLWIIIFGINLILKYSKVDPEPTTTYEPHVSVMNADSKVSSSISKSIEEMIDKYVGYCNDGNYQAAFNMLSEECREKQFNNSISEFMKNVLENIPTPKDYSIQDYSNINIDGKNTYIYSIKYFDNYLATGLTGTDYKYTTEKLTFYSEGNELKMSAGNYIYYADVKKISENEYLKIDVLDKKVNYSIETYTVKFTNRSDYTVVIADGFEDNEIQLKLNNESRERVYRDQDIILRPKQSMELELIFSKFVDDGDISQALNFSSIRILEKYSGSNAEESIIREELNNAISKMSMQVEL